MKVRELRDLAPEDLQQKEKTLKKELFDLNFHRKYGRVEKPGRFKAIRRTIAQIKTILSEKKNDGTKK